MVVIAKVAFLVGAVLTVFLIVYLIDDASQNEWLVAIVAIVFIGACTLALIWMALFLFTRMARERLTPSNRFRRLRGTGPGDPVALDPDVPEAALISSPRGHAALYTRIAVFLLLGSPALALLVYILVAYGHSAWSVGNEADIRAWDWESPRNLSDFGRWYFSDDDLGLKMLLTTASSLLLGMGAVLMPLAVPRLLRRGQDAIDIGVTRSGVIVRGGLDLEWKDIAEVLVVRDGRLTGYAEARKERLPGEPRIAINLTYIPEHSRTRIALVLHDLPGIAARAPRSAPLYADHTTSYGYALCDLWTYPRDRVQDAIDAARRDANRMGVRVTELQRAVGAKGLE